MTRILAAMIILSALLWMAPGVLAHETDAAGDTSGAGASIGNAMCPVTTDESADPAIFVDYRGRRVYFCCPRCRKKFIDDPDAYVANLSPVAEHAVLGEGAEALDGPAPPAFGARTLRFAGKLHPLVVHFPIALLLTALVVELLGLTVSSASLREVARVLVLVGAPSAAVSALLGWLAARGASYPEELARVLTLHRWLGTATAAVAVGTLVLSERGRRHGRHHRSHVVLLGVTALLAGITGHFGGTLVLGPEHFTW